MSSVSFIRTKLTTLIGMSNIFFHQHRDDDDRRRWRWRDANISLRIQNNIQQVSIFLVTNENG